MSLHRDFEENHSFSDFPMEEKAEDMSHKKRIKKLLDDRLERKRLKEEFDELDGEFDWDELER